MHVSFALFADAANISQEGKLNILGVFDAVHVGQIPALHPRATFVVRIKATAADVGKHALALRWLNPRGAELWGSDAELEVGAAPPGNQELDMPVILQLDLPLDQRLANYIIEGSKDGLIDDLELKRAEGALPLDIINVEGGAIAHGHAIGATGAVLTTRLLHAMQRDGLSRGIVTLCIGGGQGIALALERIGE